MVIVNWLGGHPYFCGIMALAVMWIISGIVTHRFAPWALAVGANNTLSASQFQFLTFTAITAYSYVAVFFARIGLEGAATIALPEIPTNLLVLMGFSVMTATGSKGITVSYLQQRQLPAEDKSDLVSGRDGSTELTKVQMLMWTLIAAVIYVIQIVRFINDRQWLLPDSLYALPDIDGALLVLMGVSQGGYVAGKLVSRAGALPSVEKTLPERARGKTNVRLEGNFFGDSKDGNSVLLKDSTGVEHLVAPDKIQAWSDVLIEFEFPDNLASGSGKLVVRSMGRPSKPIAIEVAGAPEIDTIKPSPSKAGGEITLTGKWFGMYRKQTDKVSVGATGAEDFTKWTDTQIVLVVPSNVPAGDHDVVVTSEGVAGKAKKVTVAS